MFRTQLYETQSKIGAQFEPWCGWNIASEFSDPRTEYLALRREAGLIDAGYSGKLRFSGKDRAGYLNNMLTNNIRNLEPGTGCYAALLTRQGFMESDAWVYALPDELWLECPPCGTEQAAATLRKHIVSERVEIADATLEFGILSVQGPRAAAIVSQVLRTDISSLSSRLSHRLIVRGTRDWLAVNRDRTGSGGFDLWVPVSDLESSWEELVTLCAPVGFRAWNQARTEAGIPWYGIDMNDRTLPMEMGLDSAISLKKGCYRGQEIVARITYRGRLERRLAGIAVQAETAPEPGSEVRARELKIGSVTSAAFSPALDRPLALAVLKNDYAAAGTVVEILTSRGLRQGDVVHLPVTGAFPAL